MDRCQRILAARALARSRSLKPRAFLGLMQGPITVPLHPLVQGNRHSRPQKERRAGPQSKRPQAAGRCSLCKRLAA